MCHILCQHAREEDEQLLSFRGRCSFRQCVPSKPAKYGLCNMSTTYAWSMLPYLGKATRDTKAENEQGEWVVVMAITAGLTGHTVTKDNFFTSVMLVKDLLVERKMKQAGVTIVPKRGKNMLLVRSHCNTRKLILWNFLPPTGSRNLEFRASIPYVH